MDREGNVLEEHMPQELLDVPTPAEEETPELDEPLETVRAGDGAVA